MKLPETESAISLVPDDILLKILEIGIQTSTLTLPDLSSLSLSCKHFHNLSHDDTLWSALLSRDFPRNPIPNAAPSSSSSHGRPSVKSSYKRALLKRVRIRGRHNGRLLAMYEERLGVLGRRLKRLHRQVKVVVEQMKENTGVLLQMIKDNYVVCLRRLVNVNKKHMRTEIKVSCMRRIVANDDDFLLAFGNGKHKNVADDDAEMGSSEDIENSLEVESEEDGLEVFEDSGEFSDSSDDGYGWSFS